MKNSRDLKKRRQLGPIHTTRKFCGVKLLQKTRTCKHQWNITAKQPVTEDVAWATKDVALGKQSGRAPTSEDLFGTASETTSGDDGEEHLQSAVQETSAAGMTTARAYGVVTNRYTSYWNDKCLSA